MLPNCMLRVVLVHLTYLLTLHLLRDADVLSSLGRRCNPSDAGLPPDDDLCFIGQLSSGIRSMDDQEGSGIQASNR